ncbi:unnamed protein product [Lactuca saligna]|uniref:DUF4283 domain-containing protein n=1 Tax=Lactuca saligna TaxID=75948 RepID=A0AA35Y1C5_LACSI|nr:unnamed protein product [Lactuca saligna]
MEGVPPDLEPDVIMRKKGKNAKLKNKLKLVLDSESNQLNDTLKAKSVTTLVNKFELEAISIDRKISSELTGEVSADKSDSSGNEIVKPSSDSEVDAMAPLMTPLVNYITVKKEEVSTEDLSSPVLEFEKDITQFCSPGEKEAMMVFWNSLTLNEKEGFVHGLRFIKKKYNKEGEFDSSFDESIDNVKKLSSVSHRNDILMKWKELNQKKKEKVIHKLCTSKIKKQVEANIGKNRVPLKSSASLFPVAVDMKKTSDLEASDGLQKVGETLLNFIPDGIPISNNNNPVIVDLQEICSMRSQVKEKKVKKKIEIDDLVSQQLEQVCNEIIFHFPSKFNHLELANEGEFKFKYVEDDEEKYEGQMIIDEKEEIRKTGYNKNGGLLITEDMLEEMKASNTKGKEEIVTPVQVLVEEKSEGKVSYAEKVSGKKLNAANLISKIKKKADLPVGAVEMPISDILKGCSPFKTTLYGYFIDKHVNFFNVNKFAHNMWKRYGLEEVMVNEEGIYFFRFSSEQGMLNVLEGGVWMIFDSALIVRRWTTGISSARDQHDKVPVWVKIYNVPLEYWNGTGLSHIAWEIGKPLDVDAHTAKMCQEHWGRPAFMRILIEMSAANEWLKELEVFSSDLVTGERISSKCKIEYAWNPSKCSHCKVYGHRDATCGIILAKESNSLKTSKVGEENKEEKKIDLMEVLIASTKSVQEDQDGFQTVVKRNKGNNMGENSKEEMKNKKQNANQGQKGKSYGGEKIENGTKASLQGQKGNKSVKSVMTAEGNQWNKGKGSQGYNGKNQIMKGSFYSRNFEQGQTSNNDYLLNKRENNAANFMGKKDVAGFSHGSGKIEEEVKSEDRGKIKVVGQKYVSKSGLDFKISSNFDSKPHSLKSNSPFNFSTNNKFDVLNNLEEENPFVFAKKGVDEADLAYLDSVDQMEVIGGIPLTDTNMESPSQ